MSVPDLVPESVRLEVSAFDLLKPPLQVEETDQRLLTLFEIAKIIATEYDVEQMMAKCLSCLVAMVDAVDAAILLLCNGSDGNLVVKAAQGYELAPLRRLSIAPGESLLGRVFQTGRAELCSTEADVAASMIGLNPANREALSLAAEGLPPPSGALCVPLLSGQTKVGVLCLYNLYRPNSFAPSDLAFLQLVADLLALSIENARLRSELEAVRSLNEANRLKAEVISTLAHEMRTPLTSIKGYSTALLLEGATFSPDTQREFLQLIDEECDVLEDLIHDLLESSVIEAGFLKLEPQPVALPHLAREVVEGLAHRTQKHRFLVDFPPHFPIVEADPRRIAQVLRNLLDNAIKYSPDGGLVVVRGEAQETEVVVSVADQGEGIAPEHLNRLFDKFFRIKSGLGRHVVGTGLGLPIARTIVESHGGRIWAESQLGHGSTFYFTIPRRAVSTEEE